MSRGVIRIGVIGLGHWGPNHVRVLNQCEGARVVVGADPDEERRAHVGKLYRNTKITDSAEAVFARPDVDAVVIATPARTHYALAKAAVQAGKHVLLEKPMCADVAEAEELLDLVRRAGTVMMHGHVLVYNRGIQYVRDSAVRGDFGSIQYLHATRTNLGPIRSDVNVIEDLATHEITIFDYIFDRLPNWVSATGSRVLETPREDVAFVCLEYPGGVLAQVHVSWLDPRKVRTLTLVGDKRMVFWNDLDPVEPVRIYDKGIMEEPYYDSFGEFQFALRDAEILIPKVNLQEPLRLQAEAFIRRIKTGTPTLSETDSGLRVVKCLQAIGESLKSQGKRVHLG